MDERKRAAHRLLLAYREFQRAQRRAWSGGKTADVAAYAAARAELEEAEQSALRCLGVTQDRAGGEHGH